MNQQQAWFDFVGTSDIIHAEVDSYFHELPHFVDCDLVEISDRLLSQFRHKVNRSLYFVLRAWCFVFSAATVNQEQRTKYKERTIPTQTVALCICRFNR